MRITVRRFLILALTLCVGGLLFAWSGLFNVAASTGHWPVTDWFLHWVMRNSVQTHAMGIEVPPLDDEAMVQRGAGHFAAGCAPCHGAPGDPRPAVVREMTPEPPALAVRIPEWQPNELFWIVRHGVKYTGMPAWPATEREDEVWSVVAFLQRLPELNAKSYAALAFGDASPPTSEPAPPANRFETLLDGCARCHGEDGRGRAAGAFPDLSRQSEAYLAATLDAYAGRARESGIMQLAASGLDPADIQALAAHYAASPAGVAPAPGEAADPAADDSGAALVTEGDPAAGIPACANCHRDRESRYPVYPNLAGLDRDYLETQLHLFKQGARGGTAYSHVMQAIASRLSAEQISAVSGHYAAGGGAGGSL